ncbi:MAG: maleylacetoacetate isomerase [Burkholderiaceae bacterium]|nr:maleylacetoacetate isomerase [Burkholderiaceae bacterium]
MFELYTYFRSSAAFRVRIALNLKHLSWEPRVVWLPDGEQAAQPYRSLNPQGLVPTLVEGELRLTQSLAIIEYLDELHPTPALLPATPAARARVRSIALAVACDIHPLNNLRVLRYLKGTLGQDQPAIDAWYRHWCEQGLAGIELQLGDGAAGEYCHGDRPTLADVCLVPQVFNAQRFALDMGPYPQLMRRFERCMKLEAFSAAQPSAQPEASRA